MNRISEFLITRLSTNGRMKKQLLDSLKIYKTYPKSEYSKLFLLSIMKKYLFGSKSVKYETLIQEAWDKVGLNVENDEINIDNLRFKNDIAFKSEFADIFLSSDLKIDDLKSADQRVAREILKTLSVEGAYETQKVQLQKGDVVIDAGANMGLFSVFASLKNVAKVYAFEPQKEAIRILEENISKNKLQEVIKIEPFGLSDTNAVFFLNYSGDGHSSGSIVMHDDKLGSEQIQCVTIDSWARKNKIERIDFIKADIEGAERNMLMGATETLQKFQPRLAICIYHLPDDYEVISSIIKKANPAYRIQRTSHKIFAFVP